MKLINLYGGPGSGKSTGAALLFSLFKNHGINAELVTEYAKELVWSGDNNTLDNQLYVFAKQHHRLFRLIGKVDVVVTDSPLLLSTIYGDTSPLFKQLVREEHDRFDNTNVFIKRVKPYNPKGRLQDELGAVALDVKMLELVTPLGYIEAEGSEAGIKELFAKLI